MPKLIANGTSIKTGGKTYADGEEFDVEDQTVADQLLAAGHARKSGTKADAPPEDETGLDPKDPRHGDAVRALDFAAQEAAGSKGLKQTQADAKAAADGAGASPRSGSSKAGR